LGIAVTGVCSGIAVFDWSLHIFSIQWNGWNLRCSANTSVHCKWWHNSYHSSFVQRGMLLVWLFCLVFFMLIPYVVIWLLLLSSLHR